MTATPTDNPRLILGLKLRRLRQALDLTLSQLGEASGLSISYLSEIEKGKKYPKPEKMLALAETLGVPFDELVSLQVTDELSPLKQALASPFLREFPFELFGFEAGDIFNLVNTDPARAGALIHALVEVGQTSDVDVEAFLLAALRAYQQMNSNYFGDLERAAHEFRQAHDWPANEPVAAETLEEILVRDFAYRLDYEKLGENPRLRGFRSAYRPGTPPRLYVNGNLLPSQRAFVLAREIGYRVLQLEERALTSSWLRVESFDQVLNNFKASYFSGALLLDRATVEADVRRLFAEADWRPDLLIAAMDRFGATPETYFTRLTQLVPKQFGLEQMYFLRMSTLPRGGVQLTKLLNTSALPLARGLRLNEHHCRRWPSLKLLAAKGAGSAAQVAAQRSHFRRADLGFFVVSTTRQLSLDRQRRSSVTLGWLLDRRFRRVAQFWRDPKVPDVDVDLTCERCSFTPEECADRVAEASVVVAQQNRAAKEAALLTLDV